MSVISQMDVVLGARTSKFDSKMRKSKAEVRGFGSVVGSFGKAKLLGLAAGFTAALASGALFRKLLGDIKQSFADIDALGKLSDILGSNASELKALRLQAELTGVSTTTIDKAMKKWTKTLGDAKLGIGLGKTAFKELGLEAKDFINLPLDEQFGLLASKVNQFGTEAEQASFLARIFGDRIGADLLPLFKASARGIAEAREELEKWGGGLSDLQVDRVEAANDAWTRVKFGLENVWQLFVSELAPAMEDFANLIRDNSAAFVALGKTGAEALGKIVEELKRANEIAGQFKVTVGGIEFGPGGNFGKKGATALRFLTEGVGGLAPPPVGGAAGAGAGQQQSLISAVSLLSGTLASNTNAIQQKAEEEKAEVPKRRRESLSNTAILKGTREAVIAMRDQQKKEKSVNKTIEKTSKSEQAILKKIEKAVSQKVNQRGGIIVSI